MVGRLQHVANIMVQGNHFLGRLRSAVLRANKFKGTRLSSEEMKDLVLWKDFLVVAHTGIDLNLLTTREPNNILRTDACEHGLGGFSLKTGRAWRWEIPLHLRGRKSINFLEFLACVVGIMLSIEDDDPAAGYCCLSATERTLSVMATTRLTSASPGSSPASSFAELDELQPMARGGRKLGCRPPLSRSCVVRPRDYNHY